MDEERKTVGFWTSQSERDQLLEYARRTGIGSMSGTARHIVLQCLKIAEKHGVLHLQHILYDESE
jgi:hypothetical protein